MDQQKVDLFLTTNRKFFPSEKINIIRSKLIEADDTKEMVIQSLDYQDPTIMRLISLFLGGFAVDRFMLGQIGLGLLKLFTGGGCGIWIIVDWIIIMQLTKDHNYDLLMSSM
ncbi:MAG: TM2 domain-containing protein [Clostridia bacterium]|nr:TM2 domain-containing protein [Clostridia bacterium]